MQRNRGSLGTFPEYSRRERPLKESGRSRTSSRRRKGFCWGMVQRNREMLQAIRKHGGGNFYDENDRVWIRITRQGNMSFLPVEKGGSPGPWSVLPSFKKGGKTVELLEEQKL